jgi:hypothetical protein
MAYCARYGRQWTDENGTWEIHEIQGTTLENCSSEVSNIVLMTAAEYVEIKTLADKNDPLHGSLALGDSVTLTIAMLCAVCAFLGFRSGNAFQ